MEHLAKIGPLWRAVRRVKLTQIAARFDLRRKYRALQRGGVKVVPRRRSFSGWRVDALVVPDGAHEALHVLGWKMAGNAKWMAEGRPAPTAHMRDLHCLEHHYHSFAKNAGQTELVNLIAAAEQREGADSLSRVEVLAYWHPYAVSCRIANWGGVIRARLPAEESRIGERCALWADYVEWALERDILANHLLKNLWAVALYDAMASGMDLCRASLDGYLAELSRQVLLDGAHYELCPMYHAKILADLEHLATVLHRRGELADSARVRQAGIPLRGWLRHFRSEQSGWINFNDSWDDREVGRAVFSDESSEFPPSTYLRESGFVTLQAGGMRTVMDVGGVAPAFNPGHSHSDILSCIVLWRGAPLLVDPGTLHYSPNDERMFLKSCHAHNGPCLASRDHTEHVGNFRIGKSAQISPEQVFFYPTRGLARAEHNGYPGVGIQRQVSVDGTSARLEDSWKIETGRGDEDGWLRLLFPTCFKLAEMTVGDREAYIQWKLISGDLVKVSVLIEGADDPLLFFSEASYSREFGRALPATELVVRSRFGKRELKCSTCFSILPKL